MRALESVAQPRVERLAERERCVVHAAAGRLELRSAVADAERGKPSTGRAVYTALLWAYGLLNDLAHVADPQPDDEGSALALSREPVRARRGRGLSNDF